MDCTLSKKKRNSRITIDKCKPILLHWYLNVPRYVLFKCCHRARNTQHHSAGSLPPPSPIVFRYLHCPSTILSCFQPPLSAWKQSISHDALCFQVPTLKKRNRVAYTHQSHPFLSGAGEFWVRVNTFTHTESRVKKEACDSVTVSKKMIEL